MAPPNFLSAAAFLNLYWSFGGELGINRLGLQVLAGATFDQTLAESLGSQIKGAFTTHLAALMPASSQLVRVGVRDWRSPNQVEFRDTGAAVAGIGTGDPLPRAASVCVTLRTLLAGKSFTGRVYVGGWTETQNDATSNQAALASTGAVAFLQNCAIIVGTEQLALAVISRPAERQTLVKTTFHADGSSTVETVSDIRAKVGSVTPVSSLEARNNRWEYQRRRDNGRGSGAVGGLSSVVKVTL